MICPHCGENNPDNSKYCTRCSASLKAPKQAGSAPASSGLPFNPKLIILIAIALVVIIGSILIVKSLLISDDDEITEEESEDESEEESEDESEEESEEETDEDEDEDTSATDWFDDNGLSLSSAGSFTFYTMMNDGDDDTEEMEVSSKVTITESTENMPDNYKMVTATFVHDISDSDGEQGVLADGAFDRYTGTFFGFENEHPEDESSGDVSPELKDFVKITNGSDSYRIGIVSDQQTNEPIITKTISVICPKDYDGAVFFAGYSNLELDSEVKSLDPAERLYTFDELPFMDDGEECYYFSYVPAEDNGRSSWGSYEVKSAEETSQPSEPQRR